MQTQKKAFKITMKDIDKGEDELLLKNMNVTIDNVITCIIIIVIII